MAKKTRLWSAPPALIYTVIVLTLLGLLFVFDASVAESFNTFGHQYHFLKQHSAWLLLGWALMIITSFIPIAWWQKISAPMYILGLILLVLVFIPGIGKEFNGAHRWIFLGELRFQPIEFFKLALLLFSANWLSQHQKTLPFLFTAGVPAILVLLQPDLGSLLILGGTAFLLFFLAGGKISHVLGIATGIIALLLLVVLSSPYRRTRLTTFLNPQADPLGAGFHIRQITLALGRGGWFGQGIGNSRQKLAYIPEASTDSIFAIIAEEVGFVGSTAVILLFGLYFYLAARVLAKVESRFAQLLGWGIICWIGLQTLLNLAAVVALVPLTGLPLPFFSYGGSSLVMILIANGILWRLAKEYN